MAQWVLLDEGGEFDEMYKKAMKDTGFGEIFFTVLRNRGIKSENEMRSYLSPNIRSFSDAKKLKDIGKAMKILKDSIEKREKICIYGDYDVDGVCSTTILYKGLKYLGADVIYFIPDRKKDGYGLTVKNVEKIAEKECDLIFTCDNGISAISEIRRIKELGMKCIVLDHHEPLFKKERNAKIDILPDADAIIDAKQEECEFAFNEMCAGGLSYIFMREFYDHMGVKLPNEAELLVFAMIATMSDVVPLKEDNRIVARNGFKLIRNRVGLNKGLDTLIDMLELKRAVIDEQIVGFRIAPCINAPGRLDSAMTAVELFVSDDEGEINEKASKLVSMNDERKNQTETAKNRIMQNIIENNYNNDKVIVAEDDDAKEAVIGIAAGRIKDTFYRPTIVLTKGEECYKGSGRSIPGYNLFEELLGVKELFIKFGGHYMAAGLSIEKENIEILRKMLNERCKLTDDELTEKIYVDKVIKFSDISYKLVGELDTIQPYGEGNPKCLLQSNDISIENIRFVGKEKKCIQMRFSDRDGIKLQSIYFGGYEKVREELTKRYGEEKFEKIKNGTIYRIDERVDIVYTVGINSYNGRENLQLKIKDIKFKE